MVEDISSGADNRTLFFARTPQRTTENDVRALFSTFGRVEAVKCFRAAGTGPGAPGGMPSSSKGCGLVKMGAAAEAEAAIAALHETFTWKGMPAPMVVRWMEPDNQHRRRHSSRSGPQRTGGAARSWAAHARATPAPGEGGSVAMNILRALMEPIPGAQGQPATSPRHLAPCQPAQPQPPAPQQQPRCPALAARPLLVGDAGGDAGGPFAEMQRGGGAAWAAAAAQQQQQQVAHAASGLYQKAPAPQPAAFCAAQQQAAAKHLGGGGGAFVGLQLQGSCGAPGGVLLRPQQVALAGRADCGGGGGSIGCWDHPLPSVQQCAAAGYVLHSPACSGGYALPQSPSGPLQLGSPAASLQLPLQQLASVGLMTDGTVGVADPAWNSFGGGVGIDGYSGYVLQHVL